MSEGHHHGGDMGGQPPMFPSPEPHHHHHHHHHDPQHIENPSGVMPPVPGRLGYGARRYRPRVGSVGWVVQWIVRLAVIAFIVFVVFQVFHGATSTPSP
jgi:hypothetical protein